MPKGDAMLAHMNGASHAPGKCGHFGSNGLTGRTLSDDHRRNISRAVKNLWESGTLNHAGMAGKTHKPETLSRMSISRRRHIKNHSDDCRCLHRDAPSKVAWRAYDLLLRDFAIVIPEQRFGPYSVDFLLAEEWLAVEIDGDYWHRINKTDYKARDKYLLEEFGLPVVRLKEGEIA